MSELVASTGLSVGVLAQEVGIPRSSLYAVIGGRRIPNLYFMDQLLEGLMHNSQWPESRLMAGLRRARSLHERLHRKLPKPRRPARSVRVGVLPEQAALAKEFSALLDQLRQRRIDPATFRWTSEGWLRRYATGDNIPSWWALDTLETELTDRGINDAVALIEPLHDLADAARAARARERRWARVVSGGSP
ncbi:hypothetical protein ACIG5E_37845 [Kitasatospora sp. NPDC053057]|uniref:hypothetical protein n=1 Tax=Kitasatospora sp. NPDC053057 TaxID=3364062 RepID=UPI0037C516C3